MQFINGQKGEILELGKFMLYLVLIYKVMLACMPSLENFVRTVILNETCQLNIRAEFYAFL